MKRVVSGPTTPVELPTSGHRGPMPPRELTAWAKRLAATEAEIRAERGECPPTALVVVHRVLFSLDVVLRSEGQADAPPVVTPVGEERHLLPPTG